MTNRRHLLLALASIPSLASFGARAQTGTSVIEDVFSEVERQIIERYLREHAGAVKQKADDKPAGDKKTRDDKNKKEKAPPPGLAKRASLPPGLARRETLPPGLAERDFPAGLLAQMPPPRAGTRRVLVDGNAVLIEVGTRRILDVVEGWLLGG